MSIVVCLRSFVTYLQLIAAVQAQTAQEGVKVWYPPPKVQGIWGAENGEEKGVCETEWARPGQTDVWSKVPLTLNLRVSNHLINLRFRLAMNFTDNNFVDIWVFCLMDGQRVHEVNVLLNPCAGGHDVTCSLLLHIASVSQDGLATTFLLLTGSLIFMSRASMQPALSAHTHANVGVKIHPPIVQKRRAIKQHDETRSSGHSARISGVNVHPLDVWADRERMRTSADRQKRKVLVVFTNPNSSQRPQA